MTVPLAQAYTGLLADPPGNPKSVPAWNPPTRGPKGLVTIQPVSSGEYLAIRANVVRSTLRQVGRGRHESRRSQAGDDAGQIEDEHVGPEDVAAGYLMEFVRDPGLAQARAELPLPGKHLGLVHAVEPVERVRTGAGDQEDPFVSVAVDTLDRVVGAAIPLALAISQSSSASP